MTGAYTVKPLMMKELPENERPREKMLQRGVQALSEAELLAILLRTGMKNIPVKALAEDLIAKYGLAGLGGLSPQELSQARGIGEVKAVTVLAGIELGRRLSVKSPERRAIIRSPQDVADLLMPVHNHPSGDPQPSKEDIALSQNLVQAGKVLSISVIDHVIIGDGKYVSLKEKGIL